MEKRAKLSSHLTYLHAWAIDTPVSVNSHAYIVGTIETVYLSLWLGKQSLNTQ